MNKCIVENCSNINGVTFPTDSEIISKWILCLGLKKYPNENSIVCLDHFRSCILDDSICRNGEIMYIYKYIYYKALKFYR